MITNIVTSVTTGANGSCDQTFFSQPAPVNGLGIMSQHTILTGGGCITNGSAFFVTSATGFGNIKNIDHRVVV